jgi:hypothetical protein
MAASLQEGPAMPSLLHIRRAAVVAAAVLVALACGNVREDELECEEAVAKLDSCCQDFDPSPIQCTFDSGCGATTYPDLDEDTSRCIRSESCDVIVSSGVCARALRSRPNNMTDNEGAAGDPATPGVCP